MIEDFPFRDTACRPSQSPHVRAYFSEREISIGERSNRIKQHSTGVTDMSKVHELRKLMPDVDDEAIDLIFANKHIKVISHNAEDWEHGLSPTPEQVRFYREILGKIERNRGMFSVF